MSATMIHETYFMPDTSLRDARPEDDVQPEMLPSLSSRTISLHSAISVHGWDFFDGRKVWYEAELEQNFALVLAMRRDVVEIAEQPPAVTYLDDHGRKCPHTFDFRVKLTTGSTGLVAVKPAALVAKTGVDRVVELIAEQISPSLADWTLLFTDMDLSLTDLLNAKVIHHARRDPWPQDDAVITRLIRNLKREITIGELAGRSGLGGYAFEAIVRAIADGKLKPVEYGTLDDNLAVVAAKRKRKA
ncbi:hypothetical protein [Bradyrhizobium viridifuturi]|uniref:hypothetical protein n=1 Tax=Bradyrhizobium viridifuturi TaxID=1654716 RepID=UPI00067EA878|nr:hypothetical protein [Bradyrhizobium viridifuturi]